MVGRLGRGLLILAALCPAAGVRAATVLDDASGLDAVEVSEVVRPTSEDQARAALKSVAEAGRKVSIAGSRHSMGGQTLGVGRIVVDMTAMDRVDYDTATEIVAVEAGATWAKVLKVLDPLGRSVRVMQSDNVFTVGGSLSVNAHGWQAKSAPLVSSVESFRLLLSSGQVVECSRRSNADLFGAALGGYGLFGVILDARLRTAPNLNYRRWVGFGRADDLPRHFEKEVDGRPAAEMAYARLSLDENRFLLDAGLHVFAREESQPASLPAMGSEFLPGLSRAVFQAEERGNFAKKRRWFLEKRLSLAQNGRLVTRNTVMNPDLGSYWPAAPGRRDILHEYFVPRPRFKEFLDGLRKTVPAHKANLLNVTVRDVRKDDETTLAYARADSFAFVMFFSQEPSPAGEDDMRALTGELVDLAESLGGAFYLPYRPHYSLDQLRKAYPRLDEFLKLKRERDPGELFSSSFYERISGR